VCYAEANFFRITRITNRVFAMSFDYPDYAELQKKSKLLCVLWRMGDMGCYGGIFGAIGAPLLVISEQFTNRANHWPWGKTLVFAASMAGIFMCIIVISSILKYCAVRLGKRLKKKY
jgi:hypothetical protein